MKIFKLIGYIVSVISTTACSMLPLKSELMIRVDSQSQGENYVAVKNIPNSQPACMRRNPNQQYQRRYFTNARYCFDKNYFPETIIVEYAKWKTYEDQRNNGMIAPSSGYDILQQDLYYKQMDEYYKKVDIDIDKIPASQWHRVVLHPQQLRAKYKGQIPEGRGYRPSGTIIGVNITIQPDGSPKVTDYHTWFSTISPMKDWAR